ncbi:MAG: sigma-70 family RNA polymerase sigma factor [Phycisphaerae bacterium]
MTTATAHRRRNASQADMADGELTAREWDIYGRIPEEVDYVDNPMFRKPDAEERLFGDESMDIDVPAWTYFPEIDDEPQPMRAKRRKLTRQEEAELFLRYNYACYRLSRLIEAQRRRFSQHRAKEMVRWYCHVKSTQSELVRANLPLVISMAKRTKVANVDFGEMVSEGNMALLRAVEKFDVSRGFKFSTYACRAILKSLNRLATKTGRYRERFPAEYDPSMERSDYDIKKHQMQRDDAVDALRDLLARNLARLSTVEQTVLSERFALGAGGKGRTLAQVGKTVGLTTERVRQIQNAAVQKVRAAMDKEYFSG